MRRRGSPPAIAIRDAWDDPRPRVAGRDRRGARPRPGHPLFSGPPCDDRSAGADAEPLQRRPSDPPGTFGCPGRDDVPWGQAPISFPRRPRLAGAMART